jgi:signal transduction histidine kinase
MEERPVGRTPADLYEVARQLSDGLGKATAHTRALSHGLIPVDIDAEGLRAALEELVRSVGQLKSIECRFDSSDGVQVSDNYVANHLYRIAQEAVANALRHGAPKQMVISLQEQDGQVVLRVHDDGVGITASESPHDGMGLRIMQYRASVIGAALSVQSERQSGTTIECRCVKRRSQEGDPSSASLSWGELS